MMFTTGLPCSLMASERKTAADVIAALLRESDDFPTLGSISDASSLSKPTVGRWRDDHAGATTQDQLADLLDELGRSPDDYGVRPSLAWRSRSAMRAQRALPAWADTIAADTGNIPIVLAELRALAKDVAKITDWIDQQPKVTA